MKFKLILLVLSFIACIGCSNIDDMDSDAGPSFSDLVLYGEDGTGILQVNVSDDASMVTTNNISSALGFSAFDVVNINNSLVTFFQVTPNNFNAYQVNYRTSQSVVLQGICDIDQGEYRRGLMVSNKLIGFITTQENSAQPLNFLYTYNKRSQLCSKNIIGNGNLVGSRFVDSESLYVTTIRNDEEFIIKKIDLNSLSFQTELIFDDVFKATVQDQNLYIFKPNNDLEIYNKDTFELISTTNFDYNATPPDLGLFESIIKDNLLYYNIQYTQPSPIGFGPATIDLNSGEFVMGQDQFGVSLWERVTNTLVDNIIFREFAYDLVNDQIIYAFDKGPIGGEGGIVYTNFNGDILKIVELDMVPTIIIPL